MALDPSEVDAGLLGGHLPGSGVMFRALGLEFGNPILDFLFGAEAMGRGTIVFEPPSEVGILVTVSSS